MKKLLVAMTTLATVLCMGCGSKSQNNDSAQTVENENPSKVLVAYFSATGNTKGVAEEIAEATGGKLYEIAPVPRYTDDDLNWRDKNSRSTIEMNDSTCRPAIADEPLDIADYDIVFIGYPIWWDLAPRQVNTFIEKYDLAGKTLIPFATSGGSSIDNSAKQLKKLYPEYNWRDGMLLNDRDEVAGWVESQLK